MTQSINILPIYILIFIHPPCQLLSFRIALCLSALMLVKI